MKYISITGTLICLLILSASSLDIKKEKKQTECLALALQGGGDMGAFQIGAFKGFVDRLRPEQVRYDVITGVSVGSINAGAIALHKIGNETGAAEYLNQMWRSFGPQNIYTSWDYGWVEGLTMRPGLFDNSVEIDYLT